MKDDQETVERHPAFGQIAIGRVTCSPGVYLYGSDFSHHRMIMIEVTESERHRTVAHDWHHARRSLLRLSLSEAQWATFVSSVGQAEGVPCTIDQVDGVRRPDVERPKDREEQFSGEVADRLGIVQHSLDELAAAVAASGLSGLKQKAMASLINTARMNLDRNLDYVRRTFDQHMETTVERAKAEVNAYTAQAMARAGLAEGERPIALPAKLEGAGLALT